MAVLGVMASHLFRGSMANQGFLVRSLGSAFAFGARGVDLFFVLSGFLITGILYDSLSDSGYFRKFYARRCLRIFPLYYGVLFALLLLTPWLRIQWQHVQWSLLLYLQNTSIIQPIFHWDSHSVDLIHFWSLAVEEQFYLVWPLVIFLLRDRKKILIACAILSLSALVLRSVLAFQHNFYYTIHCSTACRADSLLIGGALALVLRGRLHDLTLRYARPVFLWTVVAIAALNLIRPMVAWHPQWIVTFDASYLAFSYTLLAVASAALIAWCLRPSSVPRSFFERPVLSFFGKYSYGLYVLHLIIFSLIVTDLRAWIDIHTGHKGMGVAGAGILTFILSVGAAYLSYNLFEKKFLHLKRYFEYTRPKPPAAPSGSLPTHETLSSAS